MENWINRWQMSYLNYRITLAKMFGNNSFIWKNLKINLSECSKFHIFTLDNQYHLSWYKHRNDHYQEKKCYVSGLCTSVQLLTPCLSCLQAELCILTWLDWIAVTWTIMCVVVTNTHIMQCGRSSLKFEFFSVRKKQNCLWSY